jgi:hypothetical protein
MGNCGTFQRGFIISGALFNKKPGDSAEKTGNPIIMFRMFLLIVSFKPPFIGSQFNSMLFPIQKTHLIHG